MTTTTIKLVDHTCGIFETYEQIEQRQEALIAQEATYISHNKVNRSTVYYEKDTVKIMQHGYKRYYLLWSIGGSFFGFQCLYCDYMQCTVLKARLESRIKQGYALTEQGLW